MHKTFCKQQKREEIIQSWLHLIIFTRETKPGTHKPIRFLVPFALSFITNQCNYDKLNKAILCLYCYSILFPNGKTALVKYGILLFSHQKGIS